ncbi:hypothetical protein D039_3507B, partial [Vibrio parahaemolyticus EKP-028]
PKLNQPSQKKVLKMVNMLSLFI